MLAKRSETPFLPLVYKMEAFDTDEFCCLYGSKIRSILKCEHSVVEFYQYSEDFKSAIEKTSRNILSSEKKVITYVKKVEALCMEARKRAIAIADINLKNCSLSRLSEIYDGIIRYYKLSCAQGYLSWFVQVIQYEALEIVKGKFYKISELSIGEKEVLNTLILSPVDSPYKKKEEELNRIASLFKKSLLQLRNKKKEYIERRLPLLNKAVEDFLNEYKWVGYDYGGPEVSYDEAISAIISANPVEKDKYSKEELVKLLDLSLAEKRVFQVLSQMSFIKDLRNSSDDLVHYYLDFLYEEIASRFNIRREEIRNLLPNEFSDLLGGKIIGIKNIKDNLSFDLFNSYKGARYSKGKEAEKIFDSMIKDEREDFLGIAEVKGMPACSGIVKGSVRVINSLHDVDVFKKGEVLVTHMTSPRFMGAITKSSAIITNEGGLTCHAAIIARELKKPCIIGTKIATKVLKDGDMIEVNADEGIIKILRRDDADKGVQTIIKRRR